VAKPPAALLKVEKFAAQKIPRVHSPLGNLLLVNTEHHPGRVRNFSGAAGRREDLKIAVFAPSQASTIIANGERRLLPGAQCKVQSCLNLSTQIHPHMGAWFSLTNAVLAECRSAAYCAASPREPACCCSLGLLRSGGHAFAIEFPSRCFLATVHFSFPRSHIAVRLHRSICVHFDSLSARSCVFFSGRVSRNT